MPVTYLSSGQVINNDYKVIDFLGEGGFGRTYLVENLKRFQEKCILKEFTHYVPGNVAKAQELFKREAKTLYYLKHDQIPTFYDYFEDNGRFFIVQEYIQGETYRKVLDEKLKQNQTFSEDEIIQFLQDLLPVLGYIHNQDVVHRDIAPDNIIKPSDGSKPYIIDFGAVKQKITQLPAGNNITSVPSQPSTRITKEGYSAPELNDGECFPSSDLYSLAATALELLTGKPPNTLFDKYSLTWNWRSYVNVSDRLAAVLNNMLPYKYQDRYTVASEVLHDLSYKSPTYQIPKTQLSPPQSPTFPQTPSFPYKKTIGVGVGVVAIAALIALPSIVGQPFCQLINTCELTTQKDRTARQDYNQAVQKADSAWDSIDENSDIQQLQSARDKMNLAIQDLENIPQETEVYSEVEQKLPEYRSKLQEIDDRILLQESQEIAQEAERTAENYQNIQQLEESLSGYQQAIDKLDRVSTNSPIEGEVKDTRERYQTELAKINQNLEREQKAKNLLQEAETAASSAQQTTKNARTIAEYERANTQWKEAIEKIKTIPEDSLVHSRSQSLAETYRQEQRKVQNTIADRKAQQQEPEPIRPKERSEPKDPTEQQQDCERGVLGLCKE